MKINLKCEALGSVQKTQKGGFIRDFLTVDNAGEKSVIKLYSANESDLTQTGVHERTVEVDNFCFAPKK